MGAELIRGAADAAPVVAEVLEPLQRLRLVEDAAGLRIPALVIWGDLDSHAGNGPGLADALSGQTHVLAGCGHMPTLEAPYSFRRALDGWL
jgi:pimeloyl-ACP methyl ester carboxylesterase